MSWYWKALVFLITMPIGYFLGYCILQFYHRWQMHRYWRRAARNTEWLRRKDE